MGRISKGNFSMKVAISGAHCTGKTSIIKKLKEEALFKNFLFLENTTREMKKSGITINEDGDVITQKVLMYEHIKNLYIHDKVRKNQWCRTDNANFISDRSVLDPYIYAKVLYNYYGKTNMPVKELEILNKEFISHYDIVFLTCVDSSFPYEDDGTRSSFVEFQKHTNNQFLEYYKTHNMDLISEFYLLTGSIEERTEFILKRCREYMNDNLG